MKIGYGMQISFHSHGQKKKEEEEECLKKKKIILSLDKKDEDPLG